MHISDKPVCKIALIWSLGDEKNIVLKANTRNIACSYSVFKNIYVICFTPFGRIYTFGRYI